jgi:methionyl-tRNA formyltransferase
MGSVRIVFMGTPEFAVPSLDALVGAGFDVVAVVTRPDKGSGRGRSIRETPVKLAALAHSIEVFEPVSIKKDEFVESLKLLHPDFLAVVAYGKILPPAVLSIPPRGCVNVHASLLPEYRGAAPINHAIINGESVTGVSTMLLDEGMDTGPVLLRAETSIGGQESAEELTDRLSKLGAALLVKTITLMVKDKLVPEAQDDTRASYAPLLTKGDGEIPWERSAEEVRNRVRGLKPWPGAYTRWKEKLLKVHSGRVGTDDAADAASGTVLNVTEASIGVKCGTGVFEITELQAQDRRRMNAADFAKGSSIAPGDMLG